MPNNDMDQPVGFALGEWVPPPFPDGSDLTGRTVALESLEPLRHGPALWEAFGPAPDSTWTYMTFGPFSGYESFLETLESFLEHPDWVPYAILVGGTPQGFASYLRVNPPDGVIEIGSITFSPALRRTTPATEAICLMMRHAFDLGYRRCEWKCDDLNAPSRRAAVRLGFTYEGTFRQATHYKGRNRDTAWYAITDREWPGLGAVLADWLAPANFDGDGKQITTVEELRDR